ncbi:MAG: ankyrin repeat domain-containing protein [Verrucomicrobiales bacterium]|jgi:ankyrin repeat protein|nr:ankyrin repeat domain-containing protein [Verrucomicrobiales bacterium]
MRLLTVSGLLALCLSLAACQSKQRQAARALAERGTPLTVAALAQTARAGDVETLRLLLQAGLDVNAADADGVTAVAAAVSAGQTAAADWLRARGADLNQPDAAGRTPLWLAAAGGDLAAVDYLLGNGADFNRAAADGRAPLAVSNRVPVIHALLQAGATPDEHGIQGQPSIVWAAAAGDRALAAKLLAAGADVDAAARAPASKDFLAIVSDKTLAYYLRKDSGVTPLMLAAGRGDLEMAKLLLARGAKKFRETKRHGSPAVYLACENRHLAVIRLLLGKSPDPADYPYAIRVSLGRQRVTVTRRGAVWLRVAVSTGAKDFETPRGEFIITNKYADWHSTIYDNAPMPFFLRLNCGAVGLHAGALPGYPASHGCIRLPSAAAEKIFNAVGIGTRVTIED